MASRHVVRPGECLLSLAARHGFADAAALHDHSDNAELKERRASPRLLSPGDVVIVPDREAKELAVPTSAEHVFRVRLPRAKLRLFVKGDDGAGLEGKRYRLRVGAEVHEGTTDGGGKVEALVPAEATAADLFVWARATGDTPDLHLPVRIGHLDPVEEPTGWRARLHHLGFACGATGPLDDATRATLKAFQRAHDLDLTGEPDDATRAKLRDLHDEEP